MTIVVSDTSPVRALHHVGQIELLRDLYGTVFIPPAVAHELESPARRFERIPLTTIPFITLRRPPDHRRARRQSDCRTLCGLTRVGALGVLVRAKQAHLIPHVLPLVDRLRSELNFFVSDDLYAEVRKAAAE